MRTRTATIVTVLTFFLCGTALADTLVRIDRQHADDLQRLRTADVAVVAEFLGAFLVEGDDAQLIRLEALGYQATVVDPHSERWDYLLTPVKDNDTLLQLNDYGTVVLREENLALLRVPQFSPLPEQLRPGCFGVTRLTRQPLQLPTFELPALRRSPDAATPNPLVQQIVGRVSNAQIQSTWEQLVANPPTGTRYSTSVGCRDSSQFCFDRYTSLGYAPQFDEWNVSHAPNVVAEIAGAVKPQRIYILVGHLDDLPSSGIAPGADDNGSGTVTVLEGARALACHSYRNTVRFLNVTGEEQGLFGSDAYATAARQRGDDIRGVLNFDMPGWEGDLIPNPENLDVSYNSFSQWLGELFAQNATTYSTGLVVDAFSCPSLTASDHASFWDQGYPAIIGITDNENYCGHGGNYPDYHQSTDTIANNGNPAFFYATVRTAVATLAELADPFVVTFHQDTYACGAAVQVTVSDPGRNLNTSAVESFQITVTSGSEPAGELVTLTERSANSKLFTGTITLSSLSPVAGDGLVTALDGETLRAQYIDALDCANNANAAYQATAQLDCVAPLINGVGATGITGTQATIAWTTNELSDGTVVWGPTIPPGTAAPGASETASHSITLTGLQECTAYYYEVRSRDVAGNLASANNGGQYFFFETLGDFGSGLQPCHAGSVTTAKPVFSCNETASFRVVDLDLNKSATVIDTAVVELISSTESTPEMITVTETSANSSRFEGTIQTITGSPQADGKLQTSNGDLLTVTYRDADNGIGRPAISFATSQIDCSGPRITDLRVESITDARATVRFHTDETTNAVLEWGATAGLGQSVSSGASATDHALVINQIASSCSPVYIRVRATDTYGQQTIADDLGAAHRFDAATIPGLYWKDDFEAPTTTWTLQGEWQVGTPQGKGGSSGGPDPTVAYNKNRAIGHDFAGIGAFQGDYEPNKTENASTPPLTGTTWRNTKLLLYKRLNVGASDDASLWITTGGTVPIYRSAGTTITDSAYSVMSFDVRSLVDGKPLVRLQIRQQSDGNGQYSGWNVDDVIFKDGSLPDYAACGGCTTNPSFVGGATAADVNACADSGVQITWERAASWGSGGSGRYAIYRSTTAAFTPSPATLIASGITTTSYTDTSAPNDVALYYIVRAENNESCGVGPANGGRVDDNTLTVTAFDWTARATPAAISALQLDRVGAAHVRLRWPVTAASASYRVLRSADPQPAGFGLLASTAQLWFEDVGAGANQETYFYLVRGVNECGNEGP